VQNFKTQIAQQGIPYQQYMEMTGMSEEKLLEDAKEPALRQVRMDLAVMAIIKAENIEASDEDVSAEYQSMADQFGMDLETVKKYLQEEQIRDQVKSRRAIDLVVENAIATKHEETEEGGEAPAENEEKPARKPRKTAAKKTDAASGEKPARKPRKKKTEEEAPAEAEKSDE